MVFGVDAFDHVLTPLLRGLRMSEPKTLKLGDPCPACGGELKAAMIVSDDAYKKAFDRENPVSLPPGADTADPDTRSELGALHRCATCGYVTRFKAKHDAAEPDPAAKTTRATATR